MWIVQQRTFSLATGWGSAKKDVSAFHARATRSTATTSQMKSRFISPAQIRISLVDTTVTLCPLNTKSSRWSIVTLTSEVGSLIVLLAASYCSAWHHRVVVSCLVRRLVLRWTCAVDGILKFENFTALALRPLASLCSAFINSSWGLPVRLTGRQNPITNKLFIIMFSNA